MIPLAKKILFLILLFLPLQLSSADQNRRTPSEDGTFTAGPFYNSATKSYFELVRINAASWDDARNAAENRKYKKTSGRLAVINRPETHMFIVKNFLFTEDTWLGLRFFCEDSKLEWADGPSHASARFSYWHAGAEHTDLSCPETGYLSTHINRNAFDWNLATWDKRSNFSLVEYPTGHK